MLNHRLINDEMNVAAPKSIAAVTAIWPIRLNQPVNQPQPGLPSRDDQ